MDDAPVHHHHHQQQQQAQQQQGQQQQGQHQMVVQQDECVAEASGSSATAWGTLEELFLASAVSRHGTDDWSAVAGELQSRAKFLNLPPGSYSAEVCKNKFEAINGRYNSLGYRNGSCGRDKEPENYPPWFEDVRKRRVAHLKRELDRHDGSILILTNRLKKLRTQNPQAANKHQHNPEKSVVDSPKLADVPATVPEISRDEEPGPPPEIADGLRKEIALSDVASENVSTLHQLDASTDKVSLVSEENPAEDIKLETEAAASVAGDVKSPLVVEELGTRTVKPVEVPDEKEIRKDEMDVDTEAQKVVDSVDTGMRVEEVEKEAGSPDAEADRQEQQGDVEVICTRSEAADVRSSDITAASKDEAGGTEKETDAGTSSVDPVDPHPDLAASAEPEVPAADLKGSKEAVKGSDGNFVEPAPEGEAEAEVPIETSAPVNKDDPQETILAPTNLEPERNAVNDAAADQLAVDRPDTDEKLQPAAELKEKIDESQGGTREADSVEEVEKANTQQDVDSPASNEEASGEQSKDSHVERSDVGSQADGLEETSPTSSRSKKLSAKLQPLLDCLLMICNHKLASFFKQKVQDDPRYDQIIRRHVDLNMIKARLQEGAYSGGLEFFRDTLLVFNNSIVYYPRDCQEHAAALVLRKLVLEEMDKLLQTESGGTKQERPGTRKREPKKTSIEAPPPAVALGRTASSKARQATSTATATATPAAASSNAAVASSVLEVSTSDNSKSKSCASLSMGAVPSSKGGEEDDAREGEPEVEGKSKPLKAYGRKNRGDQKSKAVLKEKPLEAIVKKIGKAAEEIAAAAPPPSTSSSKSKEKKDGKSAAGGIEETIPPAAAVLTTTVKKKASEDQGIPPPVRGVRNKRSSAVKDGSQRPASAVKRSRRAA